MKTWFSNLALREKQIVFFGGLFLGIFLIYEIIFAPLSNSVTTYRNKVHNDTNLLNWMQKTNQRIQALQKLSQSDNEPFSGSLLSALQTNLNDTPFQKNILQLQQAENDSVQVKLQKIPFDEFIKWLITFTQENQLTIKQFTVVPQKDPGIVNVELKLS